MKTKYLTRPFEVKSINDDGTFEGYGSVFYVEDGDKDAVAPGAFAKTLETWRQKGSMPALLWQHNSGQPIGVYEEMYEDDRGLFVKGRLLNNEVALAGEVHALMKAGAVSGLSIGYVSVDDHFDRKTGINTIKEVDLWEVSVVTFPANNMARVENVKSITTRRDFESFLRESGFSKSEAVRIASKGFERRDSALEDAEQAKMINENISIFGG